VSFYKRSSEAFGIHPPKRYNSPTRNIGKVRCSHEPETGERNRYIGLHPFFFIAAYLDPRTKKALKKMMVTNQYQEVWGLILDMMVQVASKETQNTNIQHVQ
jgi:hypothetical protein